MGFGSVFKKIGKGIWKGIKVAEPYLALAGTFAPPPFGTILASIDEIVNRAEEEYPAEGTGVEKAEFVGLNTLKVIEITTGKNADNPKTRAIVTELGGVVADIKNAEALAIQLKDKYTKLAKDLKAAIDDAKGPAVDDSPAP